MKTYEIKTEYDKKCAEMRAKQARWNAKSYAKNKEKVIAAAVEWMRLNPEASHAQSAKRRARARNAPGKCTKEDIKQIMISQRGKCACCKTPIKTDYHADHIVPLARGGDNDKRNIQLLCPPCNYSKHAKDPIDFMQSRGFLL